jgi:hypothetical protein
MGTFKLRQKPLIKTYRSYSIMGDWYRVENPIQNNYLSQNLERLEPKQGCLANDNDDADVGDG